MKLQSGDFAKNFLTYDIYDNPIELKSFKGKKILLSFYRNVVCPFCNFRVYQLSKYYPTWKEEIEMIFIFESQKEKMLQSSFHSSISPITMVGDAEKKLYKKYGVEISTIKTFSTAVSYRLQTQLRKLKQEESIKVDVKEKVSKVIPADFLIDEDFRIVEAYYGKDIADHIPLEDVMAFSMPSKVI